MKLVNGKGLNDMVGVSNTNSYRKWRNMLTRCYSERDVSYIGTTVCEEWLTFSVFKQWFDENYVEGWELDKDLLTNQCKYGPDTCIFVPRTINAFVVKPSESGLPTGVSLFKPTSKYQAKCNNPFTGKHDHIGYYLTVEEAREAYIETKLLHALELKEEMDSIDERIFPRVVGIILT